MKIPNLTSMNREELEALDASILAELQSRDIDAQEALDFASRGWRY